MESIRRQESDSLIPDFWKWFAANAQKLAQDFEQPTLLKELGDRISALGDVMWELAPGKSAENALTITPDGSRELLALTKRVVASAPQVPGWEFRYARHPRQWDLQFEMECRDGRRVEVDPREWSYVLYRLRDGTIDLTLEEPNLRGLTDDDRYLAAVLVVDAILGEEQRLESLGSLSAVPKFSAEERAKAGPLANLDSHLRALLPHG